MTKTIDRIAFELWIGKGSIKDLEAWAKLELQKDEPHPDANNLFNLSYEEAEKQSLRLAKEIHGFTLDSQQSEIWAKELLVEYCKKLLKEEIKPSDLCKLVGRFDTGFLGASQGQEGVAYYPYWLGDLWNCCGLYDESWKLSDNPHLAEEARKIIDFLGKDDLDQ